MKTLIAFGASLVTTLFALFGGVVVNLAPPPDGPFDGQRNAVGLAAFLALIVLLLAKAVSLKIQRPGVLIVLGLVLGAGFGWSAVGYYGDFNTRTFLYPDDSEFSVRLLRGTGFTSAAQRTVDSLSKSGLDRPSDAQLVAGFGGDVKSVWTEASLRSSESMLFTSYLLLISLLAGAVFLLVEGIVHLSANRTGNSTEGDVPASREPATASR